MIFIRKLFQYATAMVVTSTVLVGCGSSSDSKNDTAGATSPVVSENCFWVGPYSKDNTETNFAYPDTGALYWHSGYTLPAGATLKIKGKFPHARYMGINSYYVGDKTAVNYAAPAHSIADSAIVPEEGSVNPFVSGASRSGEFRNYEIDLAAGTTPENVPANTVYGNAEPGKKNVVLYRVYVPDEGRNGMGGVDLPTPELTLESGEILTGQEACTALTVDTEILETPFIPDATYAYLRTAGNPARNNLIEEDDKQTVRWKAAYNATYANRCSFLNQCEANPVRSVNWYANLDNQYLSAFIDREIKPVVVIRGQLPSVPATLSGDGTFDDAQAQLRYWSICQYEYFSQKVTQCLFDEQINIQPDGKYLIVTSLENDKPSNATSDCGIGFLPWSANGDGFGIREGRENHTTDGLLVIRNMLPINNFANAVQDTATPGDEATVLADYMPTAEYFTKAEFEALGCDAYTSL